MATKSNKKGPLGQDPSHMGNPMKAFREGGQKRMAAYKKGGYNTPTQNALPKKYMGGDDPMNPSGMTRPNISSPDMSNPFVKGNGLNNNKSNGLNSFKPSVTPRPTSTTSVVPSPAPVTVDPVIPAPVPVAPVAAASTLSLKEQKRLDAYNRSKLKKDSGAAKRVAKNEAIAKGYGDGTIIPMTGKDKINAALKAGETIVGGIDAVNNLRKPIGGGSPAGGGGGPAGFDQKGGSVKRKMKSGGAKPKAMYGMSMKPGMMKKGGTKKK